MCVYICLCVGVYVYIMFVCVYEHEHVVFVCINMCWPTHVSLEMSPAMWQKARSQELGHSGEESLFFLRVHGWRGSRAWRTSSPSNPKYVDSRSSLHLAPLRQGFLFASFLFEHFSLLPATQ